MIVAALFLAAAASAPPELSSPFASMEVLSSFFPPEHFDQFCPEPVTVEISGMLVPGGKVEELSVSPVECDKRFEKGLTDWITGLPAERIARVTKPTRFSFRMHFLPPSDGSAPAARP